MADPLDTLNTGDIHARADVGRQLSKTGTPEQVPRLLEAARSDPSPGVRLYAICAAADILSRYRVGAARERLDTRGREAILGQLKGIDPAFNAGVFSVMACLGLPGAARRILVGLRDPRLDVRTGATVGAWRYFASAAALGDDELRAEVVGLLDDPRVRPDALARLARLCARCGWQESRPALERARSREDQVAEAAAQALLWLDQAALPGAWTGAYVSDGVDASEVSATPGERQVRVYVGGAAAWLRPGGVSAGRWARVGEGALQHDDGAPERARRMVLPWPGTERDVPALQFGGRTWYLAAGGDLAEPLEPALDAPGWEALPATVVDALLEALEEGSAGRRAAARVELRVGRTAAAAERLEALIGGKRPTPDLWFWLGEARAALQQPEAARAAWAEFVERGPKRSPLHALAQQRLAGG